MRKSQATAPIAIEYWEHDKILVGRWLQCNTSEEYINGIKEFKCVFERTAPKHTLWLNENCDIVLSQPLQKWTDIFLNIPAINSGFNGKVGIVVGSNVEHIVSVLDLFDNGEAPLSTRFFSTEAFAKQWLKAEVRFKMPKPPKININNLPKNKSQICIEIDSEELDRYLFMLNRHIKSNLFKRDKIELFCSLSRRELDVLRFITEGYNNEEISRKLFTSLNTIKTHRKNIMHKLHCRNQAELLRFSVFALYF